MTSEQRGIQFSAAVGARLREAAKERGVSSKDLATRAGVHEVSMSRYLGGHRVIPVSLLLACVEVLDIDAGALVNAARKDIGPA